MTDNDLQQIEMRIAKTTKGTWQQRGGYIHLHGADAPCVIDCLSQRTYDFDANAAFICTAREDLTALIAEVRRLQTAIATILTTAQESITSSESRNA
jgi:hypothetical protein